jgi:acetyltransferase
VAVAEARYVVDASGQQCEFAVVVADDWQHLGLARRLLDKLLESAAADGLLAMVGDVLATNHAMLGLARSLGFTVQRHPDGGAQVVQVRRELHVSAETAPAGTALTGSGLSAQPAMAAP